jgi:hypothetical protein
MENQFWNHGEKKLVAEAAKMSPQALNDILSGAQPCGRDRARRLEAATLLVLGGKRVVPAAAWAGFIDHPATVREKKGGE